jgi:hypothetical protein
MGVRHCSHIGIVGRQRYDRCLALRAEIAGAVNRLRGFCFECADISDPLLARV